MSEDDLREAIASTILDAWRAMPDGETYGEAASRFTSKILTLPEMAALIADAERVRRVREVAEELDNEPSYVPGGPLIVEYGVLCRKVAADIRRAVETPSAAPHRAERGEAPQTPGRTGQDGTERSVAISGHVEGEL